MDNKTITINAPVAGVGDVVMVRNSRTKDKRKEQGCVNRIICWSSCNDVFVWEYRIRLHRKNVDGNGIFLYVDNDNIELYIGEAFDECR